MVYIPCLCLSCFEMRHIYEDIVSLSITCCLTAGNLDIKSGKLTILVQHTVIPVHIQYLLFSNTQLFLSTSSTCYSPTHSYSCPHPVPVIHQHTVIPVHIQYLLFSSFCHYHYFMLWSVRCAREVNRIVGVSEMYGLSLWLSYTTHIKPISKVKTH